MSSLIIWVEGPLLIVTNVTIPLRQATDWVPEESSGNRKTLVDLQPRCLGRRNQQTRQVIIWEGFNKDSKHDSTWWCHAQLLNSGVSSLPGWCRSSILSPCKPTHAPSQVFFLHSFPGVVSPNKTMVIVMIIFIVGSIQESLPKIVREMPSQTGA